MTHKKTQTKAGLKFYNMTEQELLNKARARVFNLGKYVIVSQEPKAANEADYKASVLNYLPQFIEFWADLEKATGYRWKCTSYIRESPTHRMAQAFDLAPDIAQASQKHYAVYKRSDPVLYKRTELIRALQTLRTKDYSRDRTNKIGVFIEPDHLHVQVLSPMGGGDYPTNVIKWKIAKPIYPDTYDRMNLPML